MNRHFVTLLGVCLLCLLPVLGAAAPLVAKVNVSSQTMTVIQDGEPLYQWPVSTARSGKWTPRGTFTAQWLSRYHKSSLYNNAPMPFSIFFRGNYAIHGTDQVTRLGQPASAGCVRLHPDHAATLFYMAETVGLSNVRVVIEN
ncbi:L,D-transpeptidase [Allosediminivita pacifica]|uniref:L,D-transpeptidase-like protein n=1 Tax=Allosediminivita pacifica TaxID=1267769 RepID=A0A2T6AZN4_9RHOB|nr:L,D-transpeptidase [Allosediminivita pacifica]PTX49260.1 L,D-transpeptidase-like protein [Allosediminivita pacifica]GGB05468.1 L,D-transpeptidase [Allosediminivita pacifica]